MELSLFNSYPVDSRFCKKKYRYSKVAQKFINNSTHMIGHPIYNLHIFGCNNNNNLKGQ